MQKIAALLTISVAGLNPAVVTRANPRVSCLFVFGLLPFSNGIHLGTPA